VFGIENEGGKEKACAPTMRKGSIRFGHWQTLPQLEVAFTSRAPHELGYPDQNTSHRNGSVISSHRIIWMLCHKIVIANMISYFYFFFCS
jgi:hypothetical protein